jgi:deoxycytidylate deaminase
VITKEDEDFLDRCDELSRGEYCSHRNVGAIVVDKNGCERGHGRNIGVPLSKVTCTGGACPRGLLPPGRGSNDYSDCIAVHAEFFAITQALRNSGVHGIYGSTMYVNSLPCSMCIKHCMAVGVIRIVWHDEAGGAGERLLGEGR